MSQSLGCKTSTVEYFRCLTLKVQHALLRCRAALSPLHDTAVSPWNAQDPRKALRRRTRRGRRPFGETPDSANLSRVLYPDSYV